MNFLEFAPVLLLWVSLLASVGLGIVAVAKGRAVWLGVATVVAVPFTGYMSLASQSVLPGLIVLAPSCAATVLLYRGRTLLALFLSLPWWVAVSYYVFIVIRGLVT
jgi:hypothetical protein